MAFVAPLVLGFVPAAAVAAGGVEEEATVEAEEEATAATEEEAGVVTQEDRACLPCEEMFPISASLRDTMGLQR